MRLRRSAEQEALAESLDRLLVKLSDPERVREVQEQHGGFDPALWAALNELGVPAMGDPASGATLLDLAVVAERAGAHLACAPVVESLVAARLLGDPGDDVVVFAPRTDGPVPFGAVASTVVDRRGPGRPVSTLGRRADADLEPADAAVDQRALDEWRALTACSQAGLARRALEIGVQYAKDRHQFGVPIGSFQSIQHRFADLAAAVDGAQLLATEAAWALEVGDPRAAWLPLAALAFCNEVAEEAALWSLHVHGGYGFMVEYAIHLYVKRAKAVALDAGRPVDDLVSLARARFSTAPPITEPGRQPDDGYDFAFDPATEQFRAEVRQFVAAHLTDEIVERAHATGTMHDWGFHRSLAAAGYLSAGWPTEVGGQGRSALEVTALQQELYASGAPVDGMGISSMVAATLLLLGNDWHKGEVLPRLLNGEALPCLGYSEPDAGSDLRAVKTRAVRDGDDWVIDGQKMFTTMAHEAEYVFLLARTDPGLTMFLVPTDMPGFSVDAVRTLGGERTNITWYDGVRIPDRCRVGDVDAGWSVMHAALVYERNSANWGEPHAFLEHVASRADLDDPLTAATLGRHVARDEVSRLLVYRSAWLAAEGGMPHVEGSMAKLFNTEWFTTMTGELLGLLGSDATRDGFVEHAYRHATVTTIYGGSSEVQRGIVAERGLGLPRSRER